MSRLTSNMDITDGSWKDLIFGIFYRVKFKYIHRYITTMTMYSFLIRIFKCLKQYLKVAYYLMNT